MENERAKIKARIPRWRKNRGSVRNAGAAVCTENSIRIDCVTESPKRQRR